MRVINVLSYAEYKKNEHDLLDLGYRYLGFEDNVFVYGKLHYRTAIRCLFWE